MSTVQPPISARPPWAAFGQLLLCEARLALRQPVGLVFGVGFPLLLLVIFGSVPKFRERPEQLGGLSVFEVYVPVLVAFTLAALAFWSLPGPLVSYRELGVLRRLSTTPLPRAWVLAAQLVINACIAVCSLLVIMVVSMVAFAVSVPKEPAGFILAFVLAAAAMFAMGLWIAAVARSAGMAGALGSLLFFPLMFFAGLWVPQQMMPSVLQRLGPLTPLGAAVQAIQGAMNGAFPSVQALLVLAAYALVFGVLAARFFRWE